jgi:hypothetical protein
MMLIPKIRRERNTLSHRNVPVEKAVMATSIDFRATIRWPILIGFRLNSGTYPTRPFRSDPHF